VAIPSWIEARVYVAAAWIVTWGVVNHVEPAVENAPIEDGLLAWDGAWYERIAEQGYLGADDPAVRFFPLWPLLGRWAGWLLTTEVALVVLANAAALAAAALLHRLTLDETGDRELARRTVRLFALAPPAFVLVMAYSEAVFITLSIAMVLATRGRRWWGAALAGYLAGLTRPVAALLAVPTVIELWRNGARRSPAAWLAVMAAPLGSLTFLAWSQVALDDWSAPLDRQRELRGEITEPLGRLVLAVREAFGGDEGDALHFVAAVVIVILTVVAIRKLSVALAAYTGVSVLVLFAADNLNSMERYALAVFPLAMAAAIATRHPVARRVAPTAAAVGLVSCTTLALYGVYVP